MRTRLGKLSHVSPLRMMALLLLGGALGTWLSTGEWMLGAAIWIGGMLGGGVLLGSLKWIDRTSHEYDERRK